MDDDIKDSEWINVKERLRPPPKPKTEPAIDKEVSEIVGEPIRGNDPRLIKIVNEWRQSAHPDKFDNHLQDPAKREDLRRRLGNKIYR